MEKMHAVCRIEKFCRSAVHGISLERNRDANDQRNYKSKIDKTATDFNIVLKDCRNFDKEISKKIKNAGVKEKPDSIVMLGGLYTASQGYFTKNDNYIELTPEQAEAIATGSLVDFRTDVQKCKFLYDEKTERFFQECLQFHVDKYCQGDSSRIISAKIDFDETTPHMQVYSVPLQERANKKGEMKMHLCAKQLVGNRIDLRQAQEEFYERIGKPRGFDRGEKVDWDKPYSERKKHETTYEHNKKQMEAVIASQREQIEEQKKELERGRIQLQKQAEAAEAMTKSKIKKNGSLFHKDEELPYKMDMKDYQAATGQVRAISQVLNSPVYAEAEIRELRLETDRMQQARRNYENKLSNIEELIEDIVKDKIEFLGITQNREIDQLEQKLAKSKNDMARFTAAIKSFIMDNNLSIEDFERGYGVRLEERTHEHHRRR